jgi:hypothetical protein
VLPPFPDTRPPPTDLPTPGPDAGEEPNDMFVPDAPDQPDAPEGDDAVQVFDAMVPDAMVPDMPLIDNGKPCVSNNQCRNGFCAQGVCCNVACTQACFACNLPTSEGVCNPVPTGQARPGECTKEDPSTCGLDGTCDGAGHCRRYPKDTECTKVSCSADTEHAAGACDGNGHCQPGASISCSPNTCMGDTCAKTCGAGAPCQKGFYCDATMHCAVQKKNGVACTGTEQCGSGFCVDTVCCDTECKGKCTGCNIKTPTDLSGTCSPAPMGQDPHGECLAQDASTCGRAGGCGPGGACLLHPMGTVCGAQSCTNSLQTNASTCNGLGVCNGNGTTDCGNYACNAVGGCRTSCTTVGDCKSGLVCNGTTCGPAALPGQILYWKLDEMAGPTAADSSGSNLNGTYAGTPMPSVVAPLAPLMFANARYLKFNKATPDAVHVTMTAALKPTNNFTLSAWFRAANVGELDTSGGEIISGGNAYLLRVRPTQLEISKRVTVAGGGAKAIQCFSTGVAASAYLDNKWHHLAGTLGSTTGLKLYFDGVKVCDQTTGDNLTNLLYNQGPDLWIGRHGNGENQWDFGGALDDVRIYNRVLGDTEIMMLSKGAP